MQETYENAILLSHYSSRSPGGVRLVNFCSPLLIFSTGFVCSSALFTPGQMSRDKEA